MTPEKLQALYGLTASKAAPWVKPLEAAFELAGIDTKQREACFLAQVGHESGNLRYTVEIWGPTEAQTRYEPPASLASRLGNTTAGSGYKYRGRGLIQITGESNYRLITQQMRKSHPNCPDFHADPETLRIPLYAAISAAVYWNIRKLNTYCDSYDFVGLTKRINGGTNGLAHRQLLYTKALIC